MCQFVRFALIVCLTFFSADLWANSTFYIFNFNESSNTLIKSVSYRLKLPPLLVQGDKYHVTIYSDGVQPVFHFQSQSNELLIDGFSGKNWSGNLGELLQNFQRIDTVEPKGRLPGGADETLVMHLNTSGCFKYNFLCSTLSDADFVVFSSQSSNHDEFDFELHDYSLLFKHVQAAIFGSQDFDPGVLLNRNAVSALAFAGRFSWRDRFVDAISSEKNSNQIIDLMTRVTKKKSALFQLPFVGEDRQQKHVENKLVFYDDPHKINLEFRRDQQICREGGRRAALSLLASQPYDLTGIARDCINQSNNFNADHSVYVLDGLLNGSHGENSKLSKEIMQQTQILPEDVKGFWEARACDLDKRNGCYSEKSALTLRNKKPAILGKSMKNGEDKKRVTESVLVDEASSTSSDEWAKIKDINKLLLVSFDEVGAGLKREVGDIGGLIFVARPVEGEGITAGRFIVEVFPNPRSPVKFTQGKYRFRVKFSIDFQREDKCASGISCVFSRPIIQAKSIPVEATFDIDKANNWRGKEEIRVGSLVPLVADGATRYVSNLKEVSLAVQKINSFNLN